MNVLSTPAAPTTVAVGAEMSQQVDGYVKNLPDYRQTGYTDTNQVRLQGLIDRISKNPALLEGNLTELFNRVTIAKLDHESR